MAACIGVDATCWSNNRGYGRHARSLLSSLVRRDVENRYVFFVDSKEVLASLPDGVNIRLIAVSRPASLSASAVGRRSAADMWRISRAMSQLSCDVLLFPTIYTYVPIFSRAKKLVMVHDVIAETYPQLTVPRRAARILWNTKVALGIYQADALITVSDYSRAGILRHFRVSPNRLFVVGEASDPVFRKLEHADLTESLKAAGISPARRLVTYVGGFGPHKNLEALVSAFHSISRRHEDALLVLVGEYRNEVFHSAYGAVRNQIARFGIADRVVFTGYLPDEELVTLLNLSYVLTLPSLMEGFGLPAVEAAACGCPVIATTESPLPSLLRDGGIFIQPTEQALTGALETMLSNPALHTSMCAAALSAASDLSWDAAAGQMMDVIGKVVAQ